MKITNNQNLSTINGKKKKKSLNLSSSSIKIDSMKAKKNLMGIVGLCWNKARALGMISKQGQ